MKKVNVLQVLFTTWLSLIALNGVAQGVAIKWQKIFGGPGDETINDICKTSDGRYVVLALADTLAGDVSCDPVGMHDVWLYKIDGQGNIIWQKCHGASKEEANPYSRIIPTSDGGLMMMVETWSDDLIDEGYHEKSDLWIVKMNAVGLIQWSRCYGGSDWDVPREILELPQKQYLVLSRSTSSDGDVPFNTDTSNFDAWVFVIDSAGNIVMNEIYGGTGYDDLYDGLLLPNNTLLLSGRTDSHDGDLQGKNVIGSDGWLLQISITGAIIKSKVHGGTGDQFLHQTIAAGTGYVSFGEVIDPGNTPEKGSYHGKEDLWAVKFDKNLNIKWQGMYGGAKQDYFARAEKAGLNGYYICGSSSSSDGDIQDKYPNSKNSWALRIDSIGNLMWTMIYGGTALDAFGCLLPVSGGMLTAGYTYSDDGDVVGHKEGKDAWLVKLKEQGLFASEKQIRFSVSPNPTRGRITIALDEDYETFTGIATIFDIYGIARWSGHMSGNELNVNSGLPPHIYIVQLQDETGETVSEQKLLIE